MFSGLRSKLGMVRVSTSPKYVSVEGIASHQLLRDMQRVWGSKALANNMFSLIRSGEVKFLHFFALDFLYIMETLYADTQTRLPKRVLRKVIDELKANTWLGDIDKDVKSIVDMSVVDHVVSFPLKPFQKAFAQHFGVMVPTYRLRGYMLDAGPGTGKTVTDLVVAAGLHAGKVVIISPKNAVERVWEDTLKDIVTHKRPYWTSAQNVPLTTDSHYYVVHYEALSTLVDFIKANWKDFKNTFVILDESHNFNRLAADRTQTLIELCQMPCVDYCLWASGTPILALGIECIPFMRCVDTLFTPEAEERFRKIYGRDAKRANDILRNRIGHLKFHVPKQDVVDIPVKTHQIKVKMPDGEKYTLENIGNILRKFIDERLAYYDKNFKHYEGQYLSALKLFEGHLKTDVERRQYKEYQAAIKVISSGFDPKLMKAEAMLCNKYELKTIIPLLPNHMKPEFKSARSVVKYVKLKVMGEALGRIVGGMRSKCHLDMIAHIDFEHYIDRAEKKTLIFTSYVEVLEATADLLFHKGYTPAKVYGATNKDLAGIVKKFYDDPDLNPLAATYQSLSTAVPLTVATDLLMLNQPFREAIRTQTIARAARLGQDCTVNVWDFLLDTGDKPNISTRSNDILEWSAAMVSSIVGVNNVDLETLTLEAKMGEDGMWECLSMEAESFKKNFIDIRDEEDLALESAETEMEHIDLPNYLYHGSAFRQTELKPGFKHTGELVQWDNTEDNTWLYASDDKDSAVMLGISSAIEKKFQLNRYQCDNKTKKMIIHVAEPLSIKDIHNLHVVVYSIKADVADGWMANHNPANGITGEYKTQRTITSNILRCEDVRIVDALRGWHVQIVVQEASMESLSTIVASIKKAFGIKTTAEKRKFEHNQVMQNDLRRNAAAVKEYLNKYFGNQSWLAKQTFNEEVSTGGMSPALSVNGKFLPTLSEVTHAIEQTKTLVKEADGLLTGMDHQVESIRDKYAAKISPEIDKDNHDEVQKLVEAAEKEFAAVKPTVFGLKGRASLCGHVITTEKVNARSHEIWLGRKIVPAHAPEKIKALTSAEILQAVKIVEDLLSWADGKWYWQGWLDFSGGDDFISKLHEYNEPLYMDFIDLWDYQTGDQVYTSSLPYPAEVAEEVSIALLHWMDRSIKGDTD